MAVSEQNRKFSHLSMGCRMAKFRIGKGRI
jgi:hypothetical protein